MPSFTFTLAPQVFVIKVSVPDNALVLDLAIQMQRAIVIHPDCQTKVDMRRVAQITANGQNLVSLGAWNEPLSDVMLRHGVSDGALLTLTCNHRQLPRPTKVEFPDGNVEEFQGAAPEHCIATVKRILQVDFPPLQSCTFDIVRKTTGARMGESETWAGLGAEETIRIVSTGKVTPGEVLLPLPLPLSPPFIPPLVTVTYVTEAETTGTLPDMLHTDTIELLRHRCQWGIGVKLADQYCVCNFQSLPSDDKLVSSLMPAGVAAQDWKECSVTVCGPVSSALMKFPPAAGSFLVTVTRADGGPFRLLVCPQDLGATVKARIAAQEGLPMAGASLRAPNGQNISDAQTVQSAGLSADMRLDLLTGGAPSPPEMMPLAVTVTALLLPFNVGVPLQLPQRTPLVKLQAALASLPHAVGRRLVDVRVADALTGVVTILQDGAPVTSSTRLIARFA